jgi:hypothetical protein
VAADPRDLLVADLLTLGRTVRTPEPDPRLVDLVLARLADGPTPRRVARRRVLVAAAVVLLALLVTPPVRAAVADWFGFGGVVVRHDPSPPASTAPPPPTAGASMSVAQAVALVTFPVALPVQLGPPQGVEVSADRRVLSTTWTGGADGDLRLDQFDGSLDYTFAKSAPGVEFTEVSGDLALWFDAPHEVVVLAPDGTRRTETARLAGHTLIWERAGTTLRLEGDLTLARALAIAGTLVAVPQPEPGR